MREPNSDKKGFLLRLIFKLVYSINLTINKGKISFLVLKDEEVDANVSDFFTNKFDNNDFMTRFECFTLRVDDSLLIDVSPNAEYEMIVNIHADLVLLSNTSFPNYDSVAEDFNLTLRIPPEKDLMKNMCNW